MVKESNKRANKDTKELSSELQEAFIEYLLENGKEPVSVFHFMKTLKMKESVFYDCFPNFTALQKSIWKGFATSTIDRLNAEPAYENYSGREKLLAFYFTLAEELKNHKSYVDLSIQHFPKLSNRPPMLESFREVFMDYVAKLLGDSTASEEITSRPIISDKYSDLLWMHLIFILKYWSEDTSEAFEKTDAAIEKSVNLAFDLMGKSVVDSAFDFAKFLFEKKN
ncbi:MAG: TetR/AcrR family transcriptional regulator [Cytophagales bacterium]|nr:TetR/AcrR family transcriptional regulator [Cytophagales bacterium]